MVFWEYKHTQVLFSQREWKKNSVKIKSENGRENKKGFVQVFVRYSAIDSDLSRGWRTHQSKIEWKIIKPSENPFRVYLFYPFHFIYNPWRLHLWSFVVFLRFSMFLYLIPDLSQSHVSMITIRRFRVGLYSEIDGHEHEIFRPQTRWQTYRLYYIVYI